MCRVSSPKGRFRDEARCQRDRSPFWQPSSNTRKGHKSEEHKEKVATGGLLTRTIQALALRVLRIQICSRQICLWLLSFRLHGQEMIPSFLCIHPIHGDYAGVRAPTVGALGAASAPAHAKYLHPCRQRRSSCRGRAKDKFARSEFGQL
jgi:hypothetical protein